MARRKSGRKAGAAVERSARAFVREAVQLEASAAEDFAGLLGAKVPAVRAAVRQFAADDVEGLLQAAALNRLVALHRQALKEAVDVWAWWHWSVLRASVEHVIKEARQAEMSLAKGYAGISDGLAPALTIEAWRWQVFQVKQMEGTQERAAADLLTGVRRQVGLAKDAGEGVEQLTERLVSEEPIWLPGITGRGVWWRTAYPFQAGLTTLSVQASNRLRQFALSAWNEAAESR